mgnify:CR=1 FL=1
MQGKKECNRLRHTCKAEVQRNILKYEVKGVYWLLNHTKSYSLCDEFFRGSYTSIISKVYPVTPRSDK